mgnify:CR=1 FL=1
MLNSRRLFPRHGILMLTAAGLLTLSVSAQNYIGGGGGRGGRGGRGGFGGKNAYVVTDPVEQQMVDNMQKAIKPGFELDTFSFARLIYDSDPYVRRRFWDDDTPDADLNLGFRLFQVTSLKVHPSFTYIHITPQELAQYPFVYIVATNGMLLTDDEVQTLRNYMLHGGFLMAEDFWGDISWKFVQYQFKRIFPDRQIVELPLSHPIFHTVFDFKYLPQMPSAGRSFYPDSPSYDNADYPTGDHFPHYYGIFDDEDHMMALICRNNHFGDGWEHEGESQVYFDRFSMPQAYPMFINILVYAMTH